MRRDFGSWLAEGTGLGRCKAFSVARDYLSDNIRCNSISPARVHTPFVDDYLRKTYPGREQEMFEALPESAAHRQNGRARGSCRPRLVPVFGRSEVHPRCGLSAG